ncbi:MAG: hypothetical protein WCL71_00055, partial [Deltaproteobacteria bacterium]
RGKSPNWPIDFYRLAKQRGNWLDFAACRHAVEDWLHTADAFLVPMSFLPSMKRRMETSYPSKLTEYAQYGKPIIIWGPEYCSGVAWAKNTGNAIVVTDSAPQMLIQAVESLIKDRDMVAEYGLKALNAADDDFKPELLQSVFVNALRYEVKQPQIFHILK